MTSHAHDQRGQSQRVERVRRARATVQAALQCHDIVQLVSWYLNSYRWRGLSHMPTLNKYKVVCGTPLQSSISSMATEQDRTTMTLCQSCGHVLNQDKLTST